MRLGTIAQAELLDRLGVKGADLYKFALLDTAIPVVVIADTSSLSASPQRRQSHIIRADVAAVGFIGILEIIPGDSAIEIQFKNDGTAGFANQPLNVFLANNSQPSGTLINISASNALSVSYQLPDEPPTNLSGVGYQAWAGNGLAAYPSNRLCEGVAVRERSAVYRISPGSKIALVGSVANTIAACQARIEEFVSYERGR
jgi:hypothetical protein